MATTPKYGWELPDVGLDANSWGDILNDDTFPAIEATIEGVETTAGNALIRNSDAGNKNRMTVRLEIKQPSSTEGIRLIRSDGDEDTDRWDLVINAGTDTLRLYKGLDGFVDPTDALVASFKRPNLESTPGVPGSDNRVILRETGDTRYIRKDTAQTTTGRLTAADTEFRVTTTTTLGFEVVRSGVSGKFLVNSAGLPRIDGNEGTARALFHATGTDVGDLTHLSAVTKEFGDQLYVSKDIFRETAWGNLIGNGEDGDMNVRRGENLDITEDTGTRKIATGRYQIVFDTPSPDNTYAVTFGYNPEETNPSSDRYYVHVANGSKTTTGFLIEVRNANGTLADVQDIYFDVRF